MSSRGTLKVGEVHPCAHLAHTFIISLGTAKLMLMQEAFSSCAIEGNRFAEVCSETLRRIMEGEPVSDRYLLGLAWALREEKPIT
jgi:hypothetical protein